MTELATSYPEAHRQDLVEPLHGHRVPDPYRWLEDAASPETRDWSAAQDELVRTHLDGLPGRDWLSERLGALLDTGYVSVPLWRAGRMFFSRHEPGDEHGKVYVREGAAERVLIDPAAIDPTGKTTLDAWVPNLEGTALAYQLSVGGDEESVLHVLDVATGERLDGPIDRCRYSAVAWLPGGEELFFVRKAAPDEVPEGQEQFHRRVWRHRVGGSTAEDTLVNAPGLYDEHNYYGVRISRDGRWLVLSANIGTAPRDSVWAPTERPAARIEQLSYLSADGTTVRMFVVSPLSGNGPRPTLLTGYGGFSVSLEPAYTPSALVWVAAGGVWAQASLRGGGEEGEAWHRAGMRESKQNVFDDFHAAADALVATGRTTHDQLAIKGGSNGGLLVGAALTQRPGAYRAVVCSAPLLDMVRFEEFSLGRTWNDEYGSADDAEELGWLLSYSPYHQVRAGTEYPAVLFTVFDSDSRVDPAHARKMCAALQHAGAGDPARRPFLLRRETDVGHGVRSVSRSVALGVDQLAFLAAHTGLELP